MVTVFISFFPPFYLSTGATSSSTLSGATSSLPATTSLPGTLATYQTGEIVLASSNLVLWLQSAVTTCDGSLEFGELAWPTTLVPS